MEKRLDHQKYKLNIELSGLIIMEDASIVLNQTIHANMINLLKRAFFIFRKINDLKN